MTNRFGRNYPIRTPTKAPKGTPPDEVFLLNSPSVLDEWSLGIKYEKGRCKANYGSYLNEREIGLD